MNLIFVGQRLSIPGGASVGTRRRHHPDGPAVNVGPVTIATHHLKTVGRPTARQPNSKRLDLLAAAPAARDDAVPDQNAAQGKTVPPLATGWWGRTY
jgi:hypothetical protein